MPIEVLTLQELYSEFGETMRWLFRNAQVVQQVDGDTATQRDGIGASLQNRFFAFRGCHIWNELCVIEVVRNDRSSLIAVVMRVSCGGKPESWDGDTDKVTMSVYIHCAGQGV